MAGTPAAFEPTAFENASFQTGAVAAGAVAQSITLGGSGYAEAEWEGYQARRRARLKQIDVEEEKREQAKQSMLAEQKRLQAKKAAKKMNAAQREKTLAKIAKYNTQILSLDRSITKAIEEITAMQEAEELRQQQIADRRKRLLLVTLAAA